MISRNQTGAVVECQLAAQFQSIRETLLHHVDEDRLETLLADWVVPTDRRLPLVFMGWSPRQLLATPFQELYCTPGVGQKKIDSLIQVLRRVAEAPFPSSQVGIPTVTSKSKVAIPEIPAISEHNQVDYSQVSETVWVGWRQRIIEHGLERETLGRFAPSLQRLSRVIWRTPLGVYTPLSLAEIREKKTYGEKRVRAVLEVFGTLQGVLGPLGYQPHLAVRYQPRMISRLEDWTRDALFRDCQISDDEFRSSFIDPIIRQIEIDGGDSLADLAQHRLGLLGPAESVLKAARRLGFMRARVYQLLNEMATIISVRWPEGSALVKRLNARIHDESGVAANLTSFESARDLFFPEVRVDSLQSAENGDSNSGPRCVISPAPGIFSGDVSEQGVTHTQLA